MRPAKENYMPYKEVPKRPTYCQDCKIVEHIFAKETYLLQHTFAKETYLLQHTFAKETYLLQHTFAKETYLLSRLRDRGGCGTSSMLKRDLYIRKETCKRDLQKRPIYYQETNPWSLRYAQHIKRKLHIQKETCKKDLYSHKIRVKDSYLLSWEKFVGLRNAHQCQRLTCERDLYMHTHKETWKRDLHAQNRSAKKTNAQDVCPCEEYLHLNAYMYLSRELLLALPKIDLQKKPTHKTYVHVNNIYIYMHIYTFAASHGYACVTPKIDLGKRPTYPKVPKVTCKRDLQKRRTYLWTIYIYVYIYTYICICTYMFTASNGERWGAGVETQQNVRGEVGGWGRVPFNEPYAPSLSTIYDGA